MADYVAREWSNGDIVTAVNLNNIEQGVAGIDLGYSCSEEWVTLTDESVTTEAPTGVVNPTPEAPISSSKQIVADTIKVTFDGTVYECNRKANDFYSYYGADLPTLPGGDIDWSQYPFAILSSQGNSRLVTETAGTHQVKIEVYEKTVETSECFDRARGYSCSGGTTTTLVDEVVTFVLS